MFFVREDAKLFSFDRVMPKLNQIGKVVFGFVWKERKRKKEREKERKKERKRERERKKERTFSVLPL